MNEKNHMIMNMRYISLISSLYIIHLRHKKDETLPFTKTWMDLEGIMLSEMSEERQILNEFTHMWNIKKKMNKSNETKKYVDTEGRVVATCMADSITDAILGSCNFSHLFTDPTQNCTVQCITTLLSRALYLRDII